MKLALLGADDQTLDLVREIGAYTPHEIVWGSELGTLEGAIRSLVPRMKAGEHWELLLGGTIADAVIVARHPDQEVRVEQLRKLLQAGVPTLVMHPICRSMLLAYELEMIRADTKTVILPYLPDRLHPVSQTFQGLFQTVARAAWEPEQILFDRYLIDRSRMAVTSQFARDVDLLQAICRPFDKMSAQGGSNEESAYANLSVQMTGEAGIPVRWNVMPAADVPCAKMTIIHTSGKITIDIVSDAAAWSVSPDNRTEPIPPLPAGVAMLAQFEQALRGEKAQAASWNDACRAIEMAETIERCLKRGRTVALHDEDFSEENTFKGTMTSLGCGLLVGGVVFAFFAALLQSFFKMIGFQAGAEFLNKWPYLLLAFMVIFLLLQGLLAVARPKEDGGHSEEPEANDDEAGKSEAQNPKSETNSNFEI